MLLTSVVSAVVGAVVGAWVTAALGSRARRREQAERLEFRIVGDRHDWQPVDDGIRKRFPDAVGSGALRLEYWAELRNLGAGAATVRAWRWWVADAWERSYYYLPLESEMELVRVGEKPTERSVEEGEEGEAFCVPADSFATLRFEGLFLVFLGEREGGPEGCAPRLAVSFRGTRDYFETGEEPLSTRDAMGLAATLARSRIMGR
jgi:hypothetical protein